MGWHFCLAIHFYYSSARDFLFAAFPFILLLLFFIPFCCCVFFCCTALFYLFTVLSPDFQLFDVCTTTKHFLSVCYCCWWLLISYISSFFFLYVHKMRQRKRNQNKFSEREKWKLTSIDFWSIFGDTCHFPAALSFCCVNSRTFSLNFTISRRFQH